MRLLAHGAEMSLFEADQISQLFADEHAERS
jgi:hypothetical protein